MFTIIVVLILFIALDLAALRWGSDSTDSLASCEWERRRHWQTHGDDQVQSPC